MWCIRVVVVVVKRRDYGGMSQKIDALLFIDLDTAGCSLIASVLIR